MDVKFTQHSLPDGRKSPWSIDRPAAIADKARRAEEKGVRFEMEVLRSGEVSLTAEIDHLGETDLLAIEVVPMGAQVPIAVDAVVTQAFEAL